MTPKHKCTECGFWTTCENNDPCDLCNPNVKTRIIEQITISPGDSYTVYEVVR